MENEEKVNGGRENEDGDVVDLNQQQKQNKEIDQTFECSKSAGDKVECESDDVLSMPEKVKGEASGLNGGDKELNPEHNDTPKQDQRVARVVLRKMSTSSIKSTKSENGAKTGDTSKLTTNSRDKTMSAEEDKKVPVSTNQSQLMSSSASRNSSTPTPPSSTRSTRSQNPEFLARQRNFLHKVHLASNHSLVAEIDRVDYDDNSSKTNKSSGSAGAIQTEDNSSVESFPGKRKRSASIGTMSPRIPSPSVTNMSGGSATVNNSGNSSPASNQVQPATKKRRSTRTDSTGSQQTSISAASPVTEATADRFCWACHKDGIVIKCETCPRVFHLRCVQLENAPTEDWVCPECMTILHAENVDTRSRAMQLLSLDQLCNLLKYAVSRMKTHPGAEPFWKAVDVMEFPQYREYVAHPMDLSQLERNIKRRLYGSTEAFVSDTKWMLHNCIIFNTYQSRLTGVARMLVKICRQEMAEIENCPDCYLNAHTRKDSWFIEVCRRPHVLVWAKLKGFPFWPAKVMRTNKEGMVDVRFFGAHDRAWVPVRECFLYSQVIPTLARNRKRNNLEACVQEVEQHTKKLREKYGAFQHAPFRTSFQPGQEAEQLRMLLPHYNPDDGGGPPATKRSKPHSVSYPFRTYQRSNHAEKEEVNKNDWRSQTLHNDESMDGFKFSDNKRKNENKGALQEENVERVSSPKRKRTASGSKVSQQGSVSSSDESDLTSQQDKTNDSAKSASLIEWSKFEESAAQLTVDVVGIVSDEDKMSIMSEDGKAEDNGDDVITTTNTTTKQTEGESEDKTAADNTSESAASEIVKKPFSGLSIVDKLQEKLLRLEKSSDSDEDVSIESAVDENSSHEDPKKTEEGSRNSEDCNTQKKITVSAKENENVTERTDSISKEIEGDTADDECRDEVRDRSESPVVNREPLRSEPKCYGKQYFPKLVLHKVCLSKDGVFQKEMNSNEPTCLFEKLTEIETVKQKTVEERVCKSSLVSETTSRLENLLKNRLEESECHLTESSSESESSSCPDNDTNSIKLNENDSEKDTSSENTSDSGEGSIEMGALKHTPEHGYSRADDEESITEENEKSSMLNINVTESNEEMCMKEEQEDNEMCRDSNERLHGDCSEVNNGSEPKSKEVTADESPPDKEAGWEIDKILIHTSESGNNDTESNKQTFNLLSEPNIKNLNICSTSEKNCELVPETERNSGSVPELEIGSGLAANSEKNVGPVFVSEECSSPLSESEKSFDPISELEKSSGPSSEMEKCFDLVSEPEKRSGTVSESEKSPGPVPESESDLLSQLEKSSDPVSEKSSDPVFELEKSSAPISELENSPGPASESENNSDPVPESEKSSVPESEKGPVPISDSEICNCEHVADDNLQNSKSAFKSEVQSAESLLLPEKTEPNPDAMRSDCALEPEKQNSQVVLDSINQNPEEIQLDVKCENSEEDNKKDEISDENNMAAPTHDESMNNDELGRKNDQDNNEESVKETNEESNKTVCNGVQETVEEKMHEKENFGSRENLSEDRDVSDADDNDTCVKNPNVKGYSAKTGELLDKKIRELNEFNKRETQTGSVTITPATSVSVTSSKSKTNESRIITDLEKDIKKEPVDPDENIKDISVLPSASSTQSSAKSSLNGKNNCLGLDKKVSDTENNSKDDKVFDKKSVMEDSGRLSSNDSPASLSEQDGILYPALFLDPSVTITLVGEEQSEVNVPTPTPPAPTPVAPVNKVKMSGSDINVNELRASVNLSKDISLTVVGSSYNGSSKDQPTSHAMECESDNEETHNTASNSTSPAVPPTVPSATVGQNGNKQKKQKLAGGTESQVRSKAKKSLTSRPSLANVTVKSHPELVNGIGAYNSKTSLMRRNSNGTNSNSSDSRRSSFGTSPHHDMLMPGSQQSGGDAHGENSASDSNNNHGNAMVVLPPVLGNPPTSTTNHIQALRAVNGNIGAPSHMSNGPDMRMMRGPHGQPHPGGTSSRISPAGQGGGSNSSASSCMPPQLKPRPQGPLLSQHPPSMPPEAGPVSAEISRHKHKLCDFFSATLEEMLRDLSSLGNAEATIKTLQLELEKLQWRHNQELAEMKHNTDLIVMEMRASMESDRQRAVAETIRQCELEKQRAVEETKKKQWCSNCGKEALFYCCWNTSYCDYPCQQRHWPQHMTSCGQNSQSNEGIGREGGDVASQKTPQLSTSSNAHHKHNSSQQQQQQPWFDSVPMFNPASPASVLYHGTCADKTDSPSPSLTEDDFDTFSNSNEGLRDRNQDVDQKDVKIGVLMGVEMPKMQKKRKRCGKCAGCTTIGNCGQCPPCNSARTHQVCRKRRCMNLQPESVATPTTKKIRLNAQQKMQQMVSNGPSGGKPMGGPPPGYNQAVMSQQQRGMSGPMGRVPPQYSGLVPVPRPGNVQVSSFTTSDQSGTPSAGTSGSSHATYICNVPRRPTWGQYCSPTTTATATYGTSVRPSTSTYGIHGPATSLFSVTSFGNK